MTAESLLFDALKGLVSDRVYPDIAPAKVTKPYITYQQVGGAAVNFVSGETPSKSNGRYQVNVWSTSRTATALLAKQIEQALRSASALQTTVLGAPVADYEPDTQLYGSRQDFSFWTS